MSRTAAQADSADCAAPRRQVLRASSVTIIRMQSDLGVLPLAPPSTKEPAYGVISQLADFRMHRLWRDGKLVFEGGHARGALAITDLRETWQCHHLSPFDNVRFHIPIAEIRSFAIDAGSPDFATLTCPAGVRDEVVSSLSLALLPALDNPRAANRLFVEQVVLAVLTHLVETYGGVNLPVRRKGLLAPWQEKRAAEFLAAHVDGGFSLAELAGTCSLSKSYFAKAFKQTFGKTPYRWLTEYRINRAKDLLLSDRAIADVASACGFADQSHLTRVFSEVVGEAPGNWRRRNRFS